MDMPESTTEFQADAPRRIRWWPAVLILAVAAGVWTYIRLLQDVPYQTQNLQTALLVLSTLPLLLLWILLLSRLRWRRRFLLSGGVLGLVGLLAASVEIRGVITLMALFR